jgi:hypothetical protein
MTSAPPWNLIENDLKESMKRRPRTLEGHHNHLIAAVFYTFLSRFVVLAKGSTSGLPTVWN